MADRHPPPDPRPPDEFVARWSQRAGDEKSEAQTFLGELLDCYDTEWRQNTDVRFEHHYPAGGFADLLWKGSVLVEMKSKYATEKLPETHWHQVFDYWDRSSFSDEGIGAPRYVLLCSFDRFVIWEPGEFPTPVADRPGPPRIDLMLDELPERVEALDFLRGSAANFAVNSVDLAEKAVGAVTRLYVSLTDRGVDAELARDFTLQVTWCCFAEDLGMFPELLMTNAAERLKGRPEGEKLRRKRIEALTDAGAGLTLLDELAAFRVLDPACGSGNFLYWH